MKNKGFTLVELLAVVVLLGLVIILVMTNGFGIFNKAKGGINKIEEDNLIEAAKVFLVEVDNDFVNSYPLGCTRDSFLNGNSCVVSVSFIIDKYMDKKPESCDETLFLNLQINYIDKNLDGETDEIDYLATPVDEAGNETVICSN